MKKEVYLSKIAFLSDDIKWWMNVLLGLLSGAIGFLFSIVQFKIISNIYTFIFILIYVIFLILTNKKIEKLKKERLKLLSKFEKDKKC